MSNRWISVHIFYSSNANPLLVECVAPLINRLRSEGMIAHYFFIRYWLGGPHVRLRLLPSTPDVEPEVKTIVEAELHRFLARRPALFEIERSAIAPLYRKMFVAEYGEEQFEAKYGKDGQIPFYDNNTFHYIDYEEELGRYAGRHGMTLSHKHFEVSSDVVIKILQTTNVHLRTIMLGGAIQLMLQLCYGFLGSEDAISRFLTGYMDFWQRSYAENSSNLFPKFDLKYDRMAPRLLRRGEELRALAFGEKYLLGTAVERQWATHIAELHSEIKELAGRNLLEVREGMDGEEGASSLLLSSYVHMTNNRLGVSILDEIYLSYLILKALGNSSIAPHEEAALAS
jgi:thiopeptide-type bacteriocin biosynthesis protein